VFQNLQYNASGMAPGRSLILPGDRNNREDHCIAWRMAARECYARRCWKNSGTRRALALGGGQIPPGGLSLFRQAVLAGAPGGCAASYESCVMF